jgi:hypothetical protein
MIPEKELTMIRKIIATLVAGSMFFGMTLNAAASPLDTEAVSNAYTQGTGAQAAPEPDAVPALAVAFVVGVAAGVAGNALYDYSQLDRIDADRIEQSALTPAAESLLDS